MTITDRATSKHYYVPDGDVLFPMGRPQRPDWHVRCELWVFLVRNDSRVFVAGGEFGFDGLAREADDVEIEALADRFKLDELREVSAAAHATPGGRSAAERPGVVVDRLARDSKAVGCPAGR